MGLKKDLAAVRNTLVPVMKETDIATAKAGITAAGKQLDTAVTTFETKKKKKMIPLLNLLFKDLDDLRSCLELETWKKESGPVAAKALVMSLIDAVVKTATTAELQAKKRD